MPLLNCLRLNLFLILYMSRLFAVDENENLLPCDGIVNYYGRVFTAAQANNYFNVLMTTIDWKNDEAYMFGKHILTKRKAAWYGDMPYSYTYSRATKLALPFTTELLALKSIAETLSGATYNSCLLNLYHNGSEAMAWHSDDEKTLEKNGAIASMSFGAERIFAFKHKQNSTTIKLLLQHGSLLIMKGATQTYWLHRLTTSAAIKQPRINLTFRTIVADAK